MHKLRELIFPTLDEAWLYNFFASVVLLIANAQALWRLVVDSSGTDAATAKTVSHDFTQLVSDSTSLSDPQIVNAVIWGLTALLGLVLALAIGGFMHSVSQDASGVSLSARREFVTKLLIRLGAVVSGVWFAVLAIFGLFPVLSAKFYQGASRVLVTWNGALLVLLSVLGLAFIMYVAAVLCRTAMLRVRVFSETIE